ncbi:MAG: hypothetical protein NTZ33_02120 [Bacteroidetes bacterium]|nr:hypothetical protein [Bacteroidota bacterium]
MNKGILLFYLIMLVNLVSGQDIIIKKNGDEIKCYVSEITFTAIKYQLPFRTGVTNKILKKDVSIIKYENGKIDTINYTSDLNRYQNIRTQIIKKGDNFYQNDKKLSLSELKEILVTDSATEYNMQNFETYHNFGNIISVAGIFFLVYGGCDAIFFPQKFFDNKESKFLYTDIPIIFGGAAVCVFSLVFLIPANTNLNKAVSIYNSKAQNTATSAFKIDFVINPAGFGLIMKF